MDSPKLKTLYDLLAEGYTVAQLATAVETYGIHGWDRFSRFFGSGQPTKGKLASEALDALADFSQYEARFYEERDAINEDLTAPIDTLDGTDNTPLHRLGWLEGKLPNFPDATGFPPPPKPKRKQTPESPTLNVLGALLLHLRDLRDSGKTMRVPSEDTLIGALQEKFEGVKWLSRTTIQNNFSDSKKAVQLAKNTV